jgi:TolB protein
MILYSVSLRSDSLEVRASSHAKVPLLIGIKGIYDKELEEVGNLLEKDLVFTGQFAVTKKIFDEKLTKKTIQQLFKQSYPIAVFLNYTDDTHAAIEWRVYDTMHAHMITGKKYIKRGDNIVGWAHNLADTVWPILTGQSGFFSTKIAYCKLIPNAKSTSMKHICIADYDGSHEQILVNTPTINIMPRWNKDANKPLLFYSEYTNENVRMVMTDMKGKRHIASNGDGINMLPSFSDDGKNVVYCASHANGTCQLYHQDKNKFRRLKYTDPATNKSLIDGNNISPCLSKDGNTIYFCSDFLIGHPQIYAYDLTKNTLEQITSGGYCASPSYCARTNKLAYTKKINGVMQLCMYDITHKKHSQLTHDASSKDECSWSPCGNYLLVATEHANHHRIANYNLATQTLHYLTAGHEHCDYPAWSPTYSTYPTVVIV